MADEDVTAHFHKELWLGEKKIAFKVISRVYFGFCPSFLRDYKMPALMSQAKCLISHGVKKVTSSTGRAERDGYLGAGCRSALCLPSLCSHFCWLRVRSVWGEGAAAAGKWEDWCS